MSTKVASALTAARLPSATGELHASLTSNLGGATPVLVMAFASTAQPLTELAPALAARFPNAVVLGASTAGEFTERGDAKNSIAAFALAGDYKVYAGIGVGLKANPEHAVRDAVEGLPSQVAGYSYRTAILLVDPLAGNGEEVALMAASALGAEQPMAGGAAGDDLKMAATFVSCGERAASDAVVVAQLFSKEPLGVGVCHGHRPLSEPLRVTKASGAIVEEIEGRPAWDVWREKTKAIAHSRGLDVDHLAPGDEGAYLLTYEAGLSAGATYKIRAPLSRKGGAISFACGIPQGTVIRITESDASGQVSSAREAARLAKAQLRGKRAAGALVFDCICRNLILGDRFASAVGGIVDELGGVPVAGFETYGEIAMDVGDMSGFHNTTSVVLAFPQ